MKNPIRLLCAAIGGRHLPKAGLTLVPSLMAAGGLCAAAVLVFVGADGSPGRDTAKQAEAAHLVSGLEPEDLQDEAEMAVLHQWARQDSSAALRWAEAFSEPTLRQRALTEISNLRNHLQSP